MIEFVLGGVCWTNVGTHCLALFFHRTTVLGRATLFAIEVNAKRANYDPKLKLHALAKSSLTPIRKSFRQLPFAFPSSAHHLRGWQFGVLRREDSTLE